jgi:hypothetical protein
MPCASKEPAIDDTIEAAPSALRPDEKRRFAAILRHRLDNGVNFFSLYTPTSVLVVKDSPHAYNSVAKRYISYGNLVVDGVVIPVVVKCMFAGTAAVTGSATENTAKNSVPEKSVWDLEREAVNAETRAYDCAVSNIDANPFFAYPYLVRKMNLSDANPSRDGNDLVKQLRSNGVDPTTDEMVFVVMEGERSNLTLKNEFEDLYESEHPDWSDDKIRSLVPTYFLDALVVGRGREKFVQHREGVERI